MSELMAVMTGGFATVAGGVMAAFVGMLVAFFPDIAGHLLAASVMSAPAALVFAKLMYPEKEEPVTRGELKVHVETPDANAIDAAARGAGEGLQLAANVGAMLLAFIALVLVHELGHAWFVRRLGHRALSVEVMGFGGLCQWDGRGSTQLDRAVIAWGGVVFQALLLLVTLTIDWLFGPPSALWQAQVLAAFTTTNLWLIGLNLLPIGPLDGSEAWKVFAAARSARIPLTRVAKRLLQGTPVAR